ncbi:hypothetical protein [Albibacterium sp.]|uniref:hypothetical protein n=1 Tax=Albibacterium sp. TaxID=2952885 RepID=UPI002C8F935B|nr:hypothetical protein [Albibacterium sp.]HUH18949.1 hypothetical protein [Albibacterium sp.]
MKGSFRYYVIVILLIYLPIEHSLAQVRYSVNAEYLVPLGDLKNNYTSGLNAGLGVKYVFNKQYDVTFNTGYTYVQGKSVEDEYFVYNVQPIAGVPLGLGIRYKPDNLFFIQASVGPVIVMKPASDFGMHYSGGAGIHYKMLEFQIRLMQWNKPEIANFAGFQLSFVF